MADFGIESWNDETKAERATSPVDEPACSRVKFEADIKCVSNQKKLVGFAILPLHAAQHNQMDAIFTMKWFLLFIARFVSTLRPSMGSIATQKRSDGDASSSQWLFIVVNGTESGQLSDENGNGVDKANVCYSLKWS